MRIRRVPVGDKDASATSRERADAVAIGLLLGLTAILVRASSSPPMSSLVLCPFRRLTGWPCPGCGMTRALNALMRGRWDAALSLHPLSPIVAAVAMLLGLSALAKAILPPQASLARWSTIGERIARTPWVVGCALAITLGVWVVRLIALISSGEAGALWHQGWLGRILAW